MTENEVPLLAPSPVRGRRLLSGIQPSGQLHLGNWFGAMQQHVAGQDANECFFFIANFHAMTSVRDPATLARLTRDVALDYLTLTDPDLGPVTGPGPARLLVAATVGGTRLIDNQEIVLRSAGGGA